MVLRRSILITGVFIHIFFYSYARDAYQPYGYNSLDEFIARKMKEYLVPGIQLNYFSLDHDHYSFNYGKRRKGRGGKVDDQTIFQSASLSKQWAVYTWYKFMQEHQIMLSDTLGKLLEPQELYRKSKLTRARDLNDYLGANDSLKSAVLSSKIADILSHQAGFRDWWVSDFALEDTDTFYYSDDGYIALQRTLSHYLDTTFEYQLNKIIFDSLALERASFIGKLDKNVAHGHDNKGKFKRKIIIPEEAMSHGYLRSTTKDLVKFYRHLFREMQSDKKLYNQLVTPLVKIEDFKNLYWSAGIGLEITDDNIFLFQWGNDRFYQHLMIYSLSIDRGVVFQTNSANGLKLAEYLVPIFLGRDLEITDFIY